MLAVPHAAARERPEPADRCRARVQRAAQAGRGQARHALRWRSADRELNLTPHENGIGRWSARDVAQLLRIGVAPNGLPVCDPMPSYYGGSFTGMGEQDALDLGQFFTAIPVQDSGVIPQCCTACHADNLLNPDAG